MRLANTNSASAGQAPGDRRTASRGGTSPAVARAARSARRTGLERVGLPRSLRRWTGLALRSARPQRLARRLLVARLSRRPVRLVVEHGRLLVLVRHAGLSLSARRRRLLGSGGGVRAAGPGLVLLRQPTRLLSVRACMPERLAPDAGPAAGGLRRRQAWAASA